MDAEKYGIAVPISEALREQSPTWAEIEEGLRRAARATPEEKARWKREAEERRAAYRDQVGTTEDIIGGIASHFGWTPEYVRHLAQPYCECDYDTDGAWNHCQHARDLGLIP